MCRSWLYLLILKSIVIACSWLSSFTIFVRASASLSSTGLLAKSEKQESIRHLGAAKTTHLGKGGEAFTGANLNLYQSNRNELKATVTVVWGYLLPSACAPIYSRLNRWLTQLNLSYRSEACTNIKTSNLEQPAHRDAVSSQCFNGKNPMLSPLSCFAFFSLINIHILKAPSFSKDIPQVYDHAKFNCLISLSLIINKSTSKTQV